MYFVYIFSRLAIGNHFKVSVLVFTISTAVLDKGINFTFKGIVYK